MIKKNGDSDLKKVIAILGVITLVAVLGVALIFAYGSYKDLELKKEEAKVTEKKESSKKQKNNNEEQLQKQSKNDSYMDTEQQQNKNDTNNEGQNESEQANTNVNNDPNDNGTISENEVTPEQKQVQPTNNNEEDTQPKYTAEDAKNMSDDEFLDAYKEGMPSEDAKAVDELSKDPAYREYLRGQIEARENGQGGNY